MAEARARALAGRPVEVERDVPELTGGADRAAIELSVEDEPAAHPGAEREHDHVPSSPGRRRSDARRARPRSHRSRSRRAIPKRVVRWSRKSMPASGMFTECDRAAPRAGRSSRNADADGADVVVRAGSSTASSSSAKRASSLLAVRRAARARSHDDAVRRPRRPARSFVPPRSTAMTRGPAMVSGYHNPSPWPPRTSHTASTEGGAPRGRSGHEPPQARPDGGQPTDGAHAYQRPEARPQAAALAPPDRLALVGLLVLRSSGRSSAISPSGAESRRRTSGSTRAPQRGAHAAGRAHALEPEQHPRARGRHRQQEQTGHAGRARTRSCSSAPIPTSTGSRSSPSRATCASTSPATARTRSTRRTRSAAPTLAIKTVESVTGLPINHVVVVDFGTFGEVIDALGGVDDRRSQADPLEQVRVPVRRPRRAAPAGRAGASRRASRTMDGTARADLLADPREPARPERDATSRAASGSSGRPGDGGRGRRASGRS